MSSIHDEHQHREKHNARQQCNEIWVILQELEARREYDAIRDIHSMARLRNGEFPVLLREESFTPRSRE